MEKESNSAVPADLAEIRERTGIMGNQSDPSLDIEAEGNEGDDATKKEIASKLNPKPNQETKPEVKTETELKGEEPDEDEEDDAEEKEPDGAKPDAGTKPAPTAKKKGSPIKTAFKIIGEQGTQIKGLTATLNTLIETLQNNAPKKEEPAKVDIIDALSKELEDQGQDPEVIKKIIAAAKASTIQELKDAGLLSEKKEDPTPELDGEDREVLNEAKDKRATEAEVQSFNTEWAAMLPALKAQYPNASEALLTQARDEMYRIATSEEGGVVIKKAKLGTDGKVLEQGKVKPYPLDYLLYQKKSTFDTLLKLAKGAKMGEGGSKEIDNGHQDEDPDAPIEMSLDNQSPETFLAMQKKDLEQGTDKDIRITGRI